MILLPVPRCFDVEYGKTNACLYLTLLKDFFDNIFDIFLEGRDFHLNLSYLLHVPYLMRKGETQVFS